MRALLASCPSPARSLPKDLRRNVECWKQIYTLLIGTCLAGLGFEVQTAEGMKRMPQSPRDEQESSDFKSLPLHTFARLPITDFVPFLAGLRIITDPEVDAFWNQGSCRLSDSSDQTGSKAMKVLNPVLIAQCHFPVDSA
eukprot:36820-Pelagomonas_calceolata.AAC.1